MHEGAWINANTGQWAFIDEHANWAKRPGNLVGIGLPSSVWDEIHITPNDYGGENRKRILLTVMAAGGIRMRGHGNVVVFEFTIGTKQALDACKDILSTIGGDFLLCRFNNLTSGECLELLYRDYK